MPLCSPFIRRGTISVAKSTINPNLELNISTCDSIKFNQLSLAMFAVIIVKCASLEVMRMKPKVKTKIKNNGPIYKCFQHIINKFANFSRFCFLFYDGVSLIFNEIIIPGQSNSFTWYTFESHPELTHTHQSILSLPAHIFHKI